MILDRILTALQSPLAKCIGVSSSINVMSFVLCNLRLRPTFPIEISGESIFRVAQHRIKANFLFLACVRKWGCSHFHSWALQSFGPQRCNHTKWARGSPIVPRAYTLLACNRAENVELLFHCHQGSTLLSPKSWTVLRTVLPFHVNFAKKKWYAHLLDSHFGFHLYISPFSPFCTVTSSLFVRCQRPHCMMGSVLRQAPSNAQIPCSWSRISEVHQKLLPECSSVWRVATDSLTVKPPSYLWDRRVVFSSAYPVWCGSTSIFCYGRFLLLWQNRGTHCLTFKSTNCSTSQWKNRMSCMVFPIVLSIVSLQTST